MYVGRIVAVGKTPKGRNTAFYRVSSRSFPNRQAIETNRGLAIVPKEGHEGDILKNPYIAYNCLRMVDSPSAAELGPIAVATNGSQTDPIAEKIASGMSIRDALVTSLLALDYEKDDYNTPRIAAVVPRTGDSGWLGVVRQDGLNVREIPLLPGKALFVATYETNDINAGHVSDYEAETAADAAQWLLDGGKFAELTNPVTGIAAVATDDGFATGIANQ